MVIDRSERRYSIQDGGDRRRLCIDIIIHPLDSFCSRVSPRHLGEAVVLFADGHVGSEITRQIECPSLENWTRFNYGNKKHWQDSEMPDAETWEPPPWE